ncbi:MAG: NADH-quinone oxidoreductase subunit L [Phycisphaerae bacterium]|nr:NADH-quinone oxidoreductase subunit L [Phycisphaerae bacterium]
MPAGISIPQMMGHVITGLLVLGTLIPLLGFVFLCFFGAKLGKPRSAHVAVGSMVITTLLAVVALICWAFVEDPAFVMREIGEYCWADFGNISIMIGVQVDSLTLIMFFMVSFVSLCIFVFSMGYMAGHSDEIDGKSKYHRFFTYLCLFDFSMLGLVISNNILFLFIFWELVGLCSYFLIGFYFHKKSASNAAIKAFVTNRVGDFGFLIGLMLVVYYLGDLSLDGAAEMFNHKFRVGDPMFTDTFLGVSMATWMGICLFCGAIGKSAQFPLHVWLPDAMEGPTPVSALIHAATMVAAGVYLVARIFCLLTPEAQLVIAFIGAITLTMAAVIAIVQTDIKKVLAYSTVSQLGYMILGMGVGAWVGALFHLLAHAFFKALLFLGSGQVIEGCHHEQDITKMGGLRRKMPVTCWTFFVAVLAISGVGLPLLNTIPGTGLGGYYSKDEILAVAYYRANPGHHGAERGHGGGQDEHGEKSTSRNAGTGELALAPSALAGQGDAQADVPAGLLGASASAAHRSAFGWNVYQMLFWAAAMVAYITPFYMMRVWWLTFMGTPRDKHVYEHAHESKLMYLPLVALAIGTFVVSWVLFRGMVAGAAPKIGLVEAIDGHSEAVHHAAHYALFYRVWPAFIVGFLLAYLIYRNGLALPGKIAVALAPLHRLVWNKFYFDELYGADILKKASLASATGLIVIARQASRWFDTYVIDFLVNVSAKMTRIGAEAVGRILDAAGLVGRIEEDRSYRTRVAMWIGSVVAVVLAVRFVMTERITEAYVTSLIGVVLLGVDGIVEGLARGAWDVGGAIRSSQTGRIRSYLLFAMGGVAVVVVAILW